MACHWLARGPAIFGLREHLERFVESTRLSRMKLAVDYDGLVEGVRAVVHANPGTRIVKVNGYYPGISLDVLPRDAHASVAIAAFSMEDLQAKKVTEPAKLQIADPRKMPAWVLSPQAKLAAGYLYTSIAKGAAREAGFHDVLLLDERGDVNESSTQSFFLIENGTLLTAPTSRVLAGVTRWAVLDLAADEGIAIKEDSVPLSTLDTAQEAFLTGTTTDIWPVGLIDARRYTAPGPITERLSRRLARVLAGDDTVFSPRWMQPV
jgi:branched-chain amino acid aminotransferase